MTRVFQMCEPTEFALEKSSVGSLKEASLLTDIGSEQSVSQVQRKGWIPGFTQQSSLVNRPQDMDMDM